jgi:hypothetical protein
VRRSANSAGSSPTYSPKQSFHSTHRVTFAYKDDQDKDSLKPGSSEYSKSGKGDDAAAHSEEAFDPDSTRPEEQERQAESNSGTAVRFLSYLLNCGISWKLIATL